MPAPADKRVLTELLLRRLRPRAQRFLIWDRKQSGLALQIRPNGPRVEVHLQLPWSREMVPPR